MANVLVEEQHLNDIADAIRDKSNTEDQYTPGEMANAISLLSGISEEDLAVKMDKANPVGTGSFSMNRKADTTVGTNSVTFGYDCEASGEDSHAEGNGSTASGSISHAEGWGTKASGTASHTEGSSTEATGNYSHAEGTATEATGDYSHAEGGQTTASGQCSHAEGWHTKALVNQHAQGHYNDTSLATAGSSSGISSDTAFVIGNGTIYSSSNAVRIDYNGKLWCKSSYSSSGADYAELFEWEDGNPDNEDRRGYFVAMDGVMIRKAEPSDSFILGIISANPCVVGNSDECYSGQYLRDEFNAYIIEETEESDPETGEVSKHQFYKVNPDYDPSLPYIHRDQRPEWDYVGMMGVLSVRDDGTCQVNGYCKPSNGGIATASDKGYRVISRVNDHIIKIVFSMYANF